jgi:hypothetical protein
MMTPLDGGVLSAPLVEREPEMASSDTSARSGAQRGRYAWW